MKRILFALMAVSMLATATSCKKCGYCKDSSGYSSDAVCKNTTASALGVDDYKEAEAQCQADGGNWVVTK